MLPPSRFAKILDADSAQYYRFSELLLGGLVLNLVAYGVGAILFAHYYYADPHDPYWTVWVLAGVAYLLAAAATALAYRTRRRRGDSLSVALHYSIFVYLLGFGAAELFWCVLLRTMADANPSIGQWSFGPIHIVPALMALSCRSAAYRWLGRRKLDEAPVLDAREGRGLERHQHRGNLPEVEGAILNRLPLDACVLRTDRDDYSLLHLTVVNGHLDALQRLLMLRPGVEVEKRTGKLGRTALFIAAERGLEAAVLMLIEGNRYMQADVNARDLGGATPLIVASARGHTRVAALLREHGAEEAGQYMGLQAVDLDLDLEEGGGGGEEERAAAAGRKATERALRAGEPGYDDDSDDSDDSDDDASDYSRGTESTVASRRSDHLDDESSSDMPRRSTAAAAAAAATAAATADTDRHSADYDDTAIGTATATATATLTATAYRPSYTQSGYVLDEERDSETVTSDWLGHSVMTATDTADADDHHSASADLDESATATATATATAIER